MKAKVIHIILISVILIEVFVLAFFGLRSCDWSTTKAPVITFNTDEILHSVNDTENSPVLTYIYENTTYSFDGPPHLLFNCYRSKDLFIEANPTVPQDAYDAFRNATIDFATQVLAKDVPSLERIKNIAQLQPVGDPQRINRARGRYILMGTITEGDWNEHVRPQASNGQHVSEVVLPGTVTIGEDTYDALCYIFNTDTSPQMHVLFGDEFMPELTQPTATQVDIYSPNGAECLAIAGATMTFTPSQVELYCARILNMEAAHE